MITIENELVGDRLRSIREMSGITAEQMSEILDVSEGHYRKIERGVYGLDIKKLIKLIKFVGVDAQYLLVGSGVSEEKYRESRTGSNAVVYEMMRYCREQMEGVK